MLRPSTDGSGGQTVYQTGTVDAGLNLQGSSLNPGQASYNPSNLSQHTAAEYLLSQLKPPPRRGRRVVAVLANLLARRTAFMESTC